MGRQARRKREGGRGEAGEAQSKETRDPRRARRAAIIVTAAIVALLVAAGVIVAVAAGTSRAAAVAASSAEVKDQREGAGAIDFRPTTAPDVGKVENLPASVALSANYPNLQPVGSEAPDFSLQAAAGGRVRLSDFRGKTVLLEFFATWCPHCQAEAPHLLRIMSSLPEARFAYLSVNADSEDAASIMAFDRYFGIHSPALLDPGDKPGSYSQPGSFGPVTQLYRVSIYPTFYVIDPRGRITWRGDHEQPDALLLLKLKDVTGS
jgi:thiol-disulfide isomerase/thioredoxin